MFIVICGSQVSGHHPWHALDDWLVATYERHAIADLARLRASGERPAVLMSTQASLATFL